MNEARIRDQLREAYGEAKYPPSLTSLVQARLRDPAPPGHTRAVGIIAALLALTIVGGLLLTRYQLSHNSLPPGTTPARPAVSAQVRPVNPNYGIPEADLDGASLGNASALVKPLNLVAYDGDSDITLFGAYADSARTILFFRSVRSLGFQSLANIEISDDYGWLNSASSLGNSVYGDSVVILWRSPRTKPSADAHLTVTLSGYLKYTFDLKVQSSIAVPVLSLEKLKLTAAVEVTPSVIYFHAVSDQASKPATTPWSVDLVDASGQSLQPSWSAEGNVGATGIGDKPAWRSETIWARPADAQTYELQTTIAGEVYRTQVVLDSPPTAQPQRVTPTDYPVEVEGLHLEGVLSYPIIISFPQSCGTRTDSSGKAFTFATYFQYGSTWYVLAFSTDSSVNQFKGPGAYTAQASLSPKALGGPAQPTFAGPVQLTVESDGSPTTGTVSGTLNWVGVTTQDAQLRVSGNWTCNTSLK